MQREEGSEADLPMYLPYAIAGRLRGLLRFFAGARCRRLVSPGQGGNQAPFNSLVHIQDPLLPLYSLSYWPEDEGPISLPSEMLRYCTPH